jgi:PmbA protein
VSDALELARRACAAAGGRLPVQATATRERSQLLRFARSRATQATTVDDVTVEVTALCDGHTASAATNGVDDDSMDACARRACEAAEAAARASGPGSYPGFPDPVVPRPHGGHDADTARLDPAPGGEALRTAFATAEGHGLEAHGVWTSGEVETAIASSGGLELHDRVTDAFMKVTCIAPDGRSGFDAAAAAAASGLDPAGIAGRAALRGSGALAGGGTAGSGRQVAQLPPGEYPVVLEPHAVGELANWLGVLAFNGLAYAEGRSALEGRLGSALGAPSVNLADSPRHPSTLPRAFDAEGVPKAPLPLVQDGVAHAVVHDSRSAALAGAASTGHATAAGGSQDGPWPTNLVLAGGGTADSMELCRPIERGVYVTRLWYTNAVRPKETLITGVTRDGTFLIESGEIAAPLADMRLTDSVLGVFGRVQDLSADPVLTSEGEFYGRRFATGVVCPALRAGAMRFTG